MKTILVLAVSSGENLKLAQKAVLEIEKQGGLADLVNLWDLDIPIFKVGVSIEGSELALVELVKKIESAKGLFFAAPEYNGGVPPLLSNILCWITRIDPENWRKYFQEKVAAISTHSGGNGNNLVRSLSAQLEHIGMNVIGRKIITTYNNKLNEESLEAVIRQLLRHSL